MSEDALTDFDRQLIEAMQQVVDHLQGKPAPMRATHYRFADAKGIREGLGMSQTAFARSFGIPLKTLQHWEQRRHNPDRTASAYLWAIEAYPEQMMDAQRRAAAMEAEQMAASA